MLNGRDIVVLIYLSTRPQGDWTVRTLASELTMAPASVQRSMSSLKASGLIMSAPILQPELMIDFPRIGLFLAHSIRPLFPPVYLGAISRGIPGAVDAAPLNTQLITRGGVTPPLVWPYYLGTARGQPIEPLHPAVPELVLAHPEPHGVGEMLALVDAIRYSNSARVTGLAKEQVIERYANPIPIGDASAGKSPASQPEK